MKTSWWEYFPVVTSSLKFHIISGDFPISNISSDFKKKSAPTYLCFNIESSIIKVKFGLQGCFFCQHVQTPCWRRLCFLTYICWMDLLMRWWMEVLFHHLPDHWAEVILPAVKHVHPSIQARTKRIDLKWTAKWLSAKFVSWCTFGKTNIPK